MHQRPIVDVGDTVSAGDVLADGASTDEGEIALGKNCLVAFMSWEGYNFEDAVILSERLVIDDELTSIHIEEYEIDARTTKLGDEEITRDIPNRSEDSLRNLDERGVVRVGLGKAGVCLHLEHDAVAVLPHKSRIERGALEIRRNMDAALVVRAGEALADDALRVLETQRPVCGNRIAEKITWRSGLAKHHPYSVIAAHDFDIQIKTIYYLRIIQHEWRSCLRLALDASTRYPADTAKASTAAPRSLFALDALEDG